MDSNVRKLLVDAQKTQGTHSLDCVYEAHLLMKKILYGTKESSSAPFGLDLLVLCAETAYENRQAEIAVDCLEVYFRSEPMQDQFLGRAYICQSLLCAPNPDYPESLDKCTGCLLKAVALGLEKPRYHFIVHNASVIYWQLIRPFLKSGSFRHLVSSLTKIISALEQIENDDKEWQAQLMITLVECHIDAGHIEEAEKIGSSAVEFVKSNAPSQLNHLLRILLYQNISEVATESCANTSESLKIFNEISRLRRQVDEGNYDRASIESSMEAILADISPADVNNDENESNNNKSKNKKRSSVSTSSAAEEQEIEKPESVEKQTSDHSEASVQEASHTETDRPMLLLELGRLALDARFPDICTKCVDLITNLSESCQLSGSFLYEVEFLKCEMCVMRAVPDDNELYRKNAIETRVCSLNQASTLLQNVRCLNNCNLIQVGCTTIWNICLPLLQFNLRHLIRSHLALIADCLECMDSLLRQLRCQIHIELSKCEEDCQSLECAISNLEKAMILDDDNVYGDRIRFALNRLKLSIDVCNKPHRPEDVARQIIEQISSTDVGDVSMIRALLLKAAMALAPEDFNVVFESESQAFDVSCVHDAREKVHYLAKKALHYQSHAEKVYQHLSHNCSSDARERALLWADLVKVARKFEIWDVCRVGAAFCFLYDTDQLLNGKVDNQPTDKRDEYSLLEWDKEMCDRTILSSITPEIPKPKVSPAELKTKTPPQEAKNKSNSGKSGASSARIAKEQAVEETKKIEVVDKSALDSELLRCFVEIHFIRAEALIQLLRQEGTELGCLPAEPVDQHKHSASYNSVVACELSDWSIYINWIESISVTTRKHFLRASLIGRNLNESWIVCRSAAYLWNYNRKLLLEHRYSALTEDYRQIVSDLQTVGHDGEAELVANVCNVLAMGLIQPYIPNQSKTKKSQTPEVKPDNKKDKGKVTNPKVTGDNKRLSDEAQPALQEALKICEYMKSITDGATQGHVVSLKVRQQVLRSWVLIKHWLIQPVGKIPVPTDETNENYHQKVTQVLVALEVVCNESMPAECKETGILPLSEIADLIEGCCLGDSLIEIQCWTRLAFQAFKSSNHDLVVRCANKAIETQLNCCVTGFTALEQQQESTNRSLVHKQLLSCVYSVYGQSLAQSCSGKISDLRASLNLLAQAACFGGRAGDYCLVLNAARNFWNIIQPLIIRPLERQLMQSYLTSVLSAIKQTTNSAGYPTYDSDSYIWPVSSLELPEQCTSLIQKISTTSLGCSADEKKDIQTKPAKSSAAATPATTKPSDTVKTKAAAAAVEADVDPDKGLNICDDLTLRANLYAVLFQSYVDMNELRKGVKVMEQAIRDMPRTDHRLLLYKYAVLTKAKLDLSFTADVQKFMNEEEILKAEMWHAVALTSPKQMIQLQAYQSAIESLKCSESDWMKCELLLELSQWLYYNKGTMTQIVDLIHWAIDILLNMYCIRPPSYSGSSTKEEEKDKDAVNKQQDPKKGKSAGLDKSRGSKASAKAPKEKPGSAKKAGKTETKAKSKGGQSSGDESQEEGLLCTRNLRPCSSEIGVDALNPEVSFNDLCDVRQLELLFRCYSLLAHINGRQSECFEIYCLTAYTIVVKIIKLSIESSVKVQGLTGEVATKQGPQKGNKNQSAKETKPQSADKSRDKSPDKAKDKSKDKSKKADKSKPTTGEKKSGLLETFEDWACYNISDELSALYQHESIASTTGLTKQTITKPSVSLYHLQELSRHLNHLGYHHFVLPVLVFEEFISKFLIKSRLRTSFIHLQAMDVCTKLNLSDGVEYHKRLTEFKINAEDQAKCREMIEAVAVRKDFEKNRLSSDENDPILPAKSQMTFLQEYDGGNIIQIWLEYSEKLIDVCHYEPVLDMLVEVQRYALAVCNGELLSRSILLMAKLSLHEAQYSQAISLCIDAQNACGGNEVYWFDIAVILFKSTLKNPDERELGRLGEARSMLQEARGRFRNLRQFKSHRPEETEAVLARLEVELGRSQANPLLSIMCDRQMSLTGEELDQLTQARESLALGAMELERLGCMSEAVEVMKDHANIYWRLALHEMCSEKKHEYFLEAESILSYAEHLMEEKYLHIRDTTLSSTALADQSKMVIPVQKDFAEVKSLHVRLLLDVFDDFVCNTVQNMIKERAKSTLQKAFDEMVCESGELSNREQSYKELTNGLGDRILNLLTSSVELTSNLLYLKAQTMFLLGRCFHLMSVLTDPDLTNQWFPDMCDTLAQEMQIVIPDQQTSPRDDKKKGDKSKPPKTPPTSPSTPGKYEKGKSRKGSGKSRAGPEEAQKMENKVTSDAEEDEKIEEEIPWHLTHYYEHMVDKFKYRKSYYELSTQFLIDACENLSQSLKISLDNNFVSLASEASLELVECFGVCHSSLSTRYLALYQSCRASLCLRNLLKDSLHDPTLSQTASLLNQYNNLVSAHGLCSPLNSPVMQSVISKLQRSSMAWNMMSVNSYHLDVIKEFPQNFLFLVLQHTPDRKYLYSAILDKSSQHGQNSAARIFRSPTCAKRIDDLTSRCRSFQSDLQQMLVRQAYRAETAADKEKILNSIEKTVPCLNLTEQCSDSWDPELLRKFVCLLRDVEEYLKPINCLLQDYLSQIQYVSSAADSSQAQYDNVVLLADQYLLELPLEALNVFKDLRISGLSRDISLQFLYHKLHRDPVLVEILKGNESLAKHQGNTNQSAKKNKVEKGKKATNSGESVVVPSSGIKYVVDPCLDFIKSEADSPMKVFSELQDLYKPKGSGLWTGITGENHILSPAEYEIHFSDTAGFLFYGTEKFVSYIPPHKLATLNLTDCQLGLFFDKMQTTRSYGRKVKQDLIKTETQRRLEDPVASALLFCLSGVKCCCVSQWFSTSSEVKQKLESFLNELLERGRSTGQAVCELRDPTRKERQETLLRVAASSPVGPGGKDKKKKDKPDKKSKEKKESAKKGSKKKPEKENKEVEEEINEEQEQEEEICVEWVIQPPSDGHQCDIPALFNFVCYGLPNVTIGVQGK